MLSPKGLHFLVVLCAVACVMIQRSFRADPAVEKGMRLLYDKGALDDRLTLNPYAFYYLQFPHTLFLHDLPEVQQKYIERQARLLRLTKGGETHHDKVPQDAHKYTKEEFPGYDIHLLDKITVQRHQLSGLCYMHAPAAVQYYNIWHNALRNNTPTDHKMLDLARVVRDTFSAEKLYQHVFEDEGGSSITFLESILQPDSVVSHSNQYQEKLQKYGPGLVALFEVREDFVNPKMHHHYGRPSGKYLGKHAMVFLAVREAEGKRYFLLQNW